MVKGDSNGRLTSQTKSHLLILFTPSSSNPSTSEQNKSINFNHHLGRPCQAIRDDSLSVHCTFLVTHPSFTSEIALILTQKQACARWSIRSKHAGLGSPSLLLPSSHLILCSISLLNFFWDFGPGGRGQRYGVFRQRQWLLSNYFSELIIMTLFVQFKFSLLELCSHFKMCTMRYLITSEKLFYYIFIFKTE